MQRDQKLYRACYYVNFFEVVSDWLANLKN